MSKFKFDANTGSDHANQEAQAADSEHECCAAQHKDEFTSQITTVGVVVVGAALFESALIPGILLGAAAALAPKFFPKLGERLQPMFHSTVRGAYKMAHKARSTVAEVQEHMSDIAAEVHAEEVGKAGDAGAGATVEGTKA